MSKRGKTDDYQDDEDWIDAFDYEERQQEKRRSNELKNNRKSNVRQRLDEHFEKRELRMRNRFLED